MTNPEICKILLRLHTLLVLGKRSNNLALAIRRALEIIPTWNENVFDKLKTSSARVVFAGFGPKFIKIIEELEQTGHIQMLDELQADVDPFFCDLCEIPSIGEKMARRMYYERSICTMGDLRIAYANDILKKIPAFGESRLRAIEKILFGDSEQDKKEIVWDGDPEENLSSEVEKLPPKKSTAIPATSVSSAPSALYSYSPSLHWERTPKIIHPSTAMPAPSKTVTKVPSLLSGICDFAELRSHGGYYVDKSLLIADLLEYPAPVVLFQRPDGFGISLAFSMIRCFLEMPSSQEASRDTVSLFKDLKIMQAGSQVLGCMGKYPVVSIRFSESNALCAGQTITQVFREFGYLAEHPGIEGFEKNRIRQMMESASVTDLISSLRFLIQMVARAAQNRVVCLIDLDFCGLPCEEMIGMMQEASDNNPALERMIIGCHESFLMQGTQTVSIHSRTREEYFGFTELEVRSILRDFHLEAQYERIREWYGNMDVSGRDVFMPSGVIQCVRSLSMTGPQVQNEWIWNLYHQKLPLMNPGKGIRDDLASLVCLPPTQTTVSREIYPNPSMDADWQAILQTGLIRSTEQIPTTRGSLKCKFCIPNKYAHFCIQYWLQNYLMHNLRLDPSQKDSLCDALVSGRPEVLEFEFRRFLMQLPGLYEPDTCYYRQILIRVLEQIREDALLRTRDGDGINPDILWIYGDRAVGFLIDAVSSESLKNARLSELTKSDPDVTQEDIQKFNQLLKNCAIQSLNRIDTGLVRSKIQLMYPGVQSVSLYGISFCRNTCACQSE